jgi:hypothetical protein
MTGENNPLPENTELLLPDQQLLETCVKEALHQTKKKMVQNGQKARLKDLFGNLSL